MDETINLSATPHCTICGGIGINIPDNPSDDSIITCIHCGADLGTYGEFKANLGETASNALGDEFAKGFEGLSNLQLIPAA